MKLQDIRVEVRDKNLVKKGIITSKYLDVTIHPILRGVGTWQIKLPASHPRVADLAQPGSGIVVSLYGQEYFSGFTVKPQEATNSTNPDGTYTFSGKDDIAILAHALAYPDPSNSNPATQAFANDERTGDVETLMRAYVHANIAGGDAGPPPIGRIAGLRQFLKVETTNLHRGPTVKKAPRFQNLGELLGELGILGNLGFRVIQRGQDLKFEVVTLNDVSDLVRLDINSGTLTSLSLERSAPNITRAIVAGQGEGTARQIIQRTTADSVAAEADWGLVIEEFIDQRNTNITAELQQAGDERLLEDGFTATAVKAVPADDQTMKLVEDWDLGDTVGLVTYGQPTAALVTEVVIIANSQRVAVGCAIGDVSGFKPEAALEARVADTQRRVSKIERTLELSEFIVSMPSGDPNADRIIFWDDSAGSFAYLGLGAPLNLVGTTLDIDSATTLAEGVVELATNAEALLGADAVRAITPSTLSATFAGRGTLNKIINGSFRTNQRVLVSAAAIQPGSYGFDCWQSLGRTNLALNPRAFASAATNWSGTGATITRLTGQVVGATTITTAIRATMTAVIGGLYANSDTVSPYALVTPGEEYTISIWLKSSVAKTIQPAIQLFNVSGVNVFSAGVGPTVALAANTWTLVTMNFTNTTGAAVRMGAYWYSTTNWVAGNTLDGTGLIITRGRDYVPFFDGNDTGCSFAGTAQVSASYSVTVVPTLTFVANVAHGQAVTLNSGGAISQSIERSNLPAGTYTVAADVTSGTLKARLYNRSSAAPIYATLPLTVTLDGSDDVQLDLLAFGGAATFANVRLDLGTADPGWHPDNIFQELARCYRRYFRSTVTTDQATVTAFGSQLATSTGGVPAPIPVPLRGKPMITFNSLYWTDRVGFNSAVTAVIISSGIAPAANAKDIAVLDIFAGFGTAGAQFRPGVLVANGVGGWLALDAEFY